MRSGRLFVPQGGEKISRTLIAAAGGHRGLPVQQAPRGGMIQPSATVTMSQQPEQ